MLEIFRKKDRQSPIGTAAGDGLAQLQISDRLFPKRIRLPDTEGRIPEWVYVRANRS